MVLALWAAGFAGGIGAALVVPRAAALVLAALGAGVFAWRLLRRSPALAVAALAAALGVCHGLGAVGRATGPPAALPPEPVPCRGVVARAPEPVEADARRSRVVLDLTDVDGRAVAVRAAVTVRAPAQVAPGDRVALRATLRAPWGLANPGLPDARLLAAARGIELQGSAPDGLVVEQPGGWGPRRAAFFVRRALAEVIERHTDGRIAGVLRTLVLGERTAVDPAVEEGFRAAGAIHVLSVSGLHLAAVAAALFFLVRAAAGAVPGLALRVPPARVAALASLPPVAFYTLVTGEAIATERAALMAAAALGATLVARRFSLAAAVAAAALVLLVRSPLALVDPSFQLSFASVIALGAGAGLMPPAPAGARPGRRALGWLAASVVASTVAGVVTAPLVAHHFAEVTPLSPVGNLALVPLVELGVLPLALGGAIAGWAWEPLGAPLLAVASWGTHLALLIAEGFRRLAPVLAVRAPTVAEAGALSAAALLAVLAAARPPGRRRGLAAVAGLLSFAALLSLGAREVRRRLTDEVRITFLDVGQGDAAVVEGPRGFAAVIDGGGSWDGDFDPGARVVEPYLRARGIGALDLVVLSHPHPDHMNGLRRVLQRFPTRALWTSGDDGRNPMYRELLALAGRAGATRDPPAPLRHAGLTLTPVAPWVGDRIAAPPGLSVNDASLVVRLRHGGRSVLFAGDIEEEGEAELVARAAIGVEVQADVLKVPHHGSDTSSSDELLRAVRPGLAVASLGRQNRFRFPRPSVVERYAGHGIRLLRTDLHGAVVLTIRADGALDATCARGCR